MYAFKRGMRGSYPSQSTFTHSLTSLSLPYTPAPLPCIAPRHPFALPLSPVAPCTARLLPQFPSLTVTSISSLNFQTTLYLSSLSRSSFLSVVCFLPLSRSSTYSLFSIASPPPPFFLSFTDFYLSHFSLTLPTYIFLALYIFTHFLCMYCLPILPLPLSFTNFFLLLLFNSFPLHVTQLPLNIFTYSLCGCDLCFLISEVPLNHPNITACFPFLQAFSSSSFLPLFLPTLPFPLPFPFRAILPLPSFLNYLAFFLSFLSLFLLWLLLFQHAAIIKRCYFFILFFIC